MSPSVTRDRSLLAGRQPSGMWGGAPVAQGPVRQAPPPTFDARATAASGADPLEAYFDHLDAAFAASGPAGAADVGTAPPVQPAAARESIPMSRRQVQPPQSSTRTATDDSFANWDPDLMGDPARPAPAEPALSFPLRAATPPPPAPLAPEPVVTPAQAAAPPPSVVSTPPPAARPVPTMPTSLVDAFAALLAAEQRIGLKPSAATMPSPVTAPADEGTPVVTEELVEAVAQRVLARLTDQSRPTILDAAERLVREEIERIKQNS